MYEILVQICEQVPTWIFWKDVYIRVTQNRNMLSEPTLFVSYQDYQRLQCSEPSYPKLVARISYGYYIYIYICIYIYIWPEGPTLTALIRLSLCLRQISLDLILMYVLISIVIPVYAMLCDSYCSKYVPASDELYFPLATYMWHITIYIYMSGYLAELTDRHYCH